MSKLSLRCSVLCAMLAMGTLSCPTLVKAEGGCPQGQYPIGGQGVQGCAPIPGATNSGASTSSAPVGRWVKTWGALASAPNGASGASVGGRSKRGAAAEAVRLCGAAGCKVDFTYYNQCAAVYVPKTGRGGTSFGSSVTIEKAEEIASNRCVTDGGIGCYKVYSACTEPEFIP
ncbi:protein of unknown function [Stenotrophomonas lactitubi]|nr:protein of unknown function [Stenotrophomonas sp. yr243]SNT66740.1 protein of unknown function [Stenotrophomonas lactitubi]